MKLCLLRWDIWNMWLKKRGLDTKRTDLDWIGYGFEKSGVLGHAS